MSLKEYTESSEYEVLTGDGWKEFTGVKRSKTDKIIKLTFGSEELKCTLDHLVQIDSGEFVEAKDLVIDQVMSTSAVLTNSEIYDKDEFVYDLLNVEDVASYITGPVISHNCAFVENFSEFSASVLPTLSSGKETRMIFTSTPNGLNHFYEYVEGARKGNNGFSFLEVPWTMVPGRDEEWKQDVMGTINHDTQKFECEYNCAFEGSSGTLISGAALKLLEYVEPIHNYVEFGYKIYQSPQRGHQYAIVVDVSRGKGLDFSAFQVIDITKLPYEQVATFRNNKLTPVDYTEFVYRSAVAYNEAMVLVEINDIGGQVADMLFFDFDYENVICTDNAGSKGKRVSMSYSNSRDRGIRTTKTVKSLGCSMLKLLIEQRKLIIRDRETIQELNVFSKKNASYEAEAGHNDDLVMCLVLFAWLSQDKVFKEESGEDIMLALRENNEDIVMENLVSFGFRYDASEEYEISSMEQSADGQWWNKSSF